MNKKKTKRITRKAIEEQMAVRRRQFYETGSPVSLILLFIFVLFASLIFGMGAGPESTFGLQNWDQTRSLLIVTGLMVMVSAAAGLYIAASEKRLLKDHMRATVLLATMLTMLGPLRLIVIFEWPIYLTIVPVMITAVIMTIAYNQRFALGLSGFQAMASLLALRDHPNFFSHEIGLLLTVGGGTVTAILLLKRVRTRSQLIKVSCVAGLFVFVMSWFVGFWEGTPTRTIFLNCVWGTGGAIFVGFLMQGLLPVIEKVFHTATDMTLLDFSDVNKPLLKRLAVEAPGTFNHSWQIGMMAEAAAESIDANGLLCRVGSYYHDIGKINKPHYFVENQAENFNQHKELSPTMSRMIIIGHVKDGLELAREYHLPWVLRQFVGSHHGTTLVEYFYHEASKKEAETGGTIADTEFRYPGPKPQTLEAAIVMLTDAVEGATRAMQEPTPSRIESVVRNMAMKRLQDGQFDDCDLTMRQLKIIEASLVKSLCGMYHGRISYPKNDKLEKLSLGTK